MKKAIKKWTVALVAVMLLACLAFAATACGPDDTDDDPPATTYTVTFDQNYPNAPAATTATVEQGKKVAEPSEPTRTGHVFTGWYTSADLSAEYDFDSAVTGNLTLYAGWEQHFTVTFVLNYDGAPAATTEDVASGDTVAAPPGTRPHRLYLYGLVHGRCVQERVFLHDRGHFRPDAVRGLDRGQRRRRDRHFQLQL